MSFTGNKHGNAADEMLKRGIKFEPASFDNDQPEPISGPLRYPCNACMDPGLCRDKNGTYGECEVNDPANS